MVFRTATEQDLIAINKIAEKVWWPAYQGVISDEQISFMLEDMYSLESLRKQMVSGVEFIMAEKENTPLGFAGFSIVETEIYKLHKLYILPTEQGSGSGKKLMEHISELAKSKGGTILELNVNRGNPALSFYRKIGFDIYQTVDIPYHQFILNDYVMRKKL